MLRFTIRDLLWLTVVVALGVGWWLNYSKTKGALLKLAESERRSLFYMDIVERLQRENYKLKREPRDWDQLQVSPNLRDFAREYFKEMKRNSPNSPQQSAPLAPNGSSE